MLHNALGEDTAAANCGENSCSEWQQKLLHAFSRTVPAAKPPLLKERQSSSGVQASLSLYLWFQGTSQARNQTSTNA
jgi:hypothetical protein